MLTLAEVLELPVVRRGLPEVVAGDELLDRELRWAHVIEMPDPDDLLKGGELVLTTGLGAGTQGRRPAALDRLRARTGAAAVAVELGSTWRERCRSRSSRRARAGVPLVAFRRAVRFVEITEAVHAAVLNSQFELLRRGEEIHRRFTELILQGRGVPEILAELAQAVGHPVCSRTPATSSSTTSPRRRAPATTSRWRRGPTCTAPRSAARRPRAPCSSTCG